MTPMLRVCSAAVLTAGLMIGPGFTQEKAETDTRSSDNDTLYPIRHLVVIFQENVSFDHYFGTYPHAANPPGEPVFIPRPGTPTVNGLTETLLTKNPNSLQPQRIDRSHVNTADQDHAYQAEQLAFDFGLMDKFVEFTGSPEAGNGPSKVMDYYDGNVVTALWHYAQYFALNDILSALISVNRPSAR
jgi:phospholipase C